MQPRHYIAALLAALSCTAVCQATTFTYTPNPANLGDLDHHHIYTWRLDNLTMNPAQITSASLTFNNIYNWNNTANVLHLHLLDTAINAGVASFVDDPSNSSPVTDLTDDFISTRYHNSPGWLVAAGTADTFLADKSFGTSPVTWTYNFTGAQLLSLENYISNGHNIALGFDPDCHFFNSGIQFQICTAPNGVPETGNAALLLGLGCIALFGLRQAQQRFAVSRR